MDCLCLGMGHERGTRSTQLRNTHQSEALVRLVAKLESDSLDFGEKGKSGILKSMPSCAEFLAEPHHRLVIHFTPKHCSWLNQIEIWFSILVAWRVTRPARKLLRRGNFTSKDDLKQRILDFKISISTSSVGFNANLNHFEGILHRHEMSLNLNGDYSHLAPIHKD